MDPKRLRLLWDFLVAGGLLTVAYNMGIDHNRLDKLEECVEKRGCVPISTEAAERIVCLESAVKECKR